MNWQIIGTLVIKEVTLFFRNRLFAVVTILSLVGYLGVYFAMSGTVEERFTLAVVAPELPPVFIEEFQERHITLYPLASQEALRAAVAAGDYRAGMVLTADILQKLANGRETQVELLYPPHTPADLDEAFTVVMQLVLNDLAYTLSGQPLSVGVDEEILGPDMTGKQIAPRDRMLPLFAVLILMVETMGLASLIAEERQRRTLQALLITPMKLPELFVGKGITGVGLAFLQATLLMLITGGLSRQPLLILAALLLGALLVTGTGFLIASAAAEMMSIIGWGILSIIILSIPALSVMFPGVISSWIKIIPSYYLVDTVHQVVNFGAGWQEVGLNLLVLLAFSVALLGLGTVVLRRTLQ